MSKSKVGLSGDHDSKISDLARKSLDEGNPTDALELVSRIRSFRQSSLITLMMIALVKKHDKAVCQRALQVFWKQVSQCPNAVNLTPAALWMQHPRGRLIAPGFNQALSARRRQLDPKWNGAWENPGLAGNVVSKYRQTQPYQVHDADLCLTLASQTSNWQKWMCRYEELGGDVDNPRYLKIYVSKFFTVRAKLPKEVKRKLRRYVEVVEEASARAFLRRLMPVRPSLKGCTFNYSLARSAMFIFVSNRKLMLEAEDWVHVALASFHVGDDPVQKIILRTLSETKRTPAMHTVFERLVQLHGLPNPRITALEELHSRISNPIWEKLITSIPIDANARMILTKYSESWLE